MGCASVKNVTPVLQVIECWQNVRHVCNEPRCLRRGEFHVNYLQKLAREYVYKTGEDLAGIGQKRYTQEHGLKKQTRVWREDPWRLVADIFNLASGPEDGPEAKYSHEVDRMIHRIWRLELEPFLREYSGKKTREDHCPTMECNGQLEKAFQAEMKGLSTADWTLPEKRENYNEPPSLYQILRSMSLRSIVLVVPED
jgi:hypothetical protein